MKPARLSRVLGTSDGVPVMRTKSLGAVAALVLVSPILMAPAMAQFKRGGGGGGGGAPHVAAPAPHVSAPAPHISAPAPRAAAPAPHFSAPAPRMAAPQPHFAAPRAAPHISAPRAAPHFAAARAAPHIASPRGPSPNVARGRIGPHAPGGIAHRNVGPAERPN